MNQTPQWDEKLPAELRKFVAPEFVFGGGALDLIGGYAAHFGARKPLVVTDSGVAEAGWCDRAVASLESAGLKCEIFSEITPNPRTSEIMAGAERYRASDCDALVAVGGGSPIDCAKGIGMVVANNRPVGDFEGVDRVLVPIPPLLCIPTTAGSAADVSQFAIISDSTQQRKLAVISKALVPDLSLVDPSCLMTVDPYLRACTGYDVLVHAIEAFVSTGHSPITDLHALEAMRLASRYLVPSITQPDDEVACTGMSLACLQAGLAFSNASLGAVHALAHVLGGRLDLPHGECNALLLEHVVDFNFAATTRRYRRVAEALGLTVDGLSDKESKEGLIDALHTLRTQAGIKGTLGDVGVSRDEIPMLASDAMRDVCIVTNPRKPTRRDLEVIYEQAL